MIQWGLCTRLLRVHYLSVTSSVEEHFRKLGWLPLPTIVTILDRPCSFCPVIHVYKVKDGILTEVDLCWIWDSFMFPTLSHYRDHQTHLSLCLSPSFQVGIFGKILIVHGVRCVLSFRTTNIRVGC